MYKLDMEDKQEHDMEGRNTILSYGDVSVVISDKCKDQVIFDLHERIVKMSNNMFSICYQLVYRYSLKKLWRKDQFR